MNKKIIYLIIFFVVLTILVKLVWDGYQKFNELKEYGASKSFQSVSSQK